MHYKNLEDHELKELVWEKMLKNKLTQKALAKHLGIGRVWLCIGLAPRRRLARQMRTRFEIFLKEDE